MKWLLYLEVGIFLVYGAWLLGESLKAPRWITVPTMAVVALIFSAILFGGR